jgi:hypothetical protein
MKPHPPQRGRVPSFSNRDIETLESRIAPAFAAVVELSSLDGNNGFKLSGEDGETAGYSVSDAGDLNGDHFDDLIVGAPGAAASAGTSYVVFGKATGFATNLNLSSLDGTEGFRIDGELAGDTSGNSVSAAGDVNADGFDDLIIGARFADPNGAFIDDRGASYVVFGKPNGFTASLGLSSLDGSNGFKISGESAIDLSGHSVSAAGDMNGDGFDDVIIGAYGADANGNPKCGVSYVVFGKAAGFAPNLDLSTLDGTNGFKISGEGAKDNSAFSVSEAGDVNGDGFDDVIIGAIRARFGNGPSYAGASYVVFGRNTAYAPNLNLSTLDGSNGFTLSGVAAEDYSGCSASTAGDFNGDGFDDLIIGAHRADANGDNSGASYLFFGKPNGFSAILSLSALDGLNGLRIGGAAAGDNSGSSVSVAGDVNGDGFSDVLISGYGADQNGADAGAAYVIFGSASGFAANLDLSTLNGVNGFTLRGVEASDQAGESVSAAGDVNGDAVDDLIIGAWRAPGSNLFGASYVVFGKKNETPSISIGDSTDMEGDAGSRLLMFPVTLSSAFPQTVTVQYSTVDGMASAGSDFIAVLDHTLTFAPGETAKTITITMLADTKVELDEAFVINLSNATNATFADNQGVGTILNDDSVQVLISTSGDRASFSDVDGDLVTVKTSQGQLVQQNFVFGQLGELIQIDLGASKPSAFSGAKITVLASGGGDGFVRVDAFHAPGVNLHQLEIDGDLGQILVGAAQPGRFAVKSLKVESIGAAVGVAQNEISTFAGKVGIVKVAHDVRSVLEFTGGASRNGKSTADVVKKVMIGGNLDGSAGGPNAGLLRAGGSIGSIVVRGSVIGGTNPSGIMIDGTLGSLSIGGDLRSDHHASPVTLSVLGDPSARNGRDAVALASFSVGGSAVNARVLAGYGTGGSALNPDASISSITVKGNWIASSAVAGVADITGDGFGRNDSPFDGDLTPQVLARIANIVINGTATGTTEPTTDCFGFTAQQLGRISIGGVPLALTVGRDDVLVDHANMDFRVVDYA